MSDLVDRACDAYFRYGACTNAAEVERLSSRVRFLENVVRSGDVAALTDAEREALWFAVSCAANVGNDTAEAALRGLITRMGVSDAIP